MCAAPVLTDRTACFVNKVGTDDAGWNAVGQPWSKLTITAALADLAANYPAATPSAPHLVAVGPGTFTLPATAWPPNTYLCADPDGRAAGETIIELTGNLTLSAAWSANTTAVGGFSNVIFRVGSGTPVIDLTIPTPSAGNPSRTLILENVSQRVTAFEFEATGSEDAIQIQNFVQDGLLTDSILFIGGTVLVLGALASNCPITCRDSAARSLTAQISGIVSTLAGAGFTASTTLGQNVTVRLTRSSIRNLTLNEVGAGVVTVSADAISIPTSANITYSGSATSADLVRLNDYGGGSGDVVGPGVATDNAVARFDGTTGKLIQNSLVTVSDTGMIYTPATMGIGALPSMGFGQRLELTTLSGAVQVGYLAAPVFSQSAVTVAASVYTNFKTEAFAFVCTNGYGVQVDLPTLGAGSSVTNLRGINVVNQGAAGITNAIGIDIAAQSGASTLNVGLRNAGSSLLNGATTVVGSVAPPAGGSTTAFMQIGTVAGFGIYYGTGAPTVSAAQGSTYMRRDGTGVNDRQYINTNGTTGWTPVVTVA